MESFWDEIQAVNCVETVDQQKLTPNGKPMFRQQTDFDYLAILQLTGNDLIVDESRTMVRAPKNENKLPMLITNGFSTFALIFHPFYQGAYEFSAPESVQVEGKDVLEDPVPACSRRAVALRAEAPPARVPRGMAGNGVDRAGVGRGGADFRRSDGQHGRHGPEIDDRRRPLRALSISKAKAPTGCPPPR